MREQRRRLTELQEQRGALEVELAQKNMSVQNLRERVQQKYHVNLDDIRSECITITYADEGPAKVHVMTPEEMAAAGAATDWDAVAQQVEALQQRIDEMGPVNLVAIEEYEETEQRYQFLSKQHDDLVQAKAQLLEVINRINVQTREMFRETFEKIRDNFRAMFTEVFGGGKADLVLMDENDLLESGIEIVARPPGKQLQTISLLSGGEQTMTAVSLLFSIYQVKPSPFCVLDELDERECQKELFEFSEGISGRRKIQVFRQLLRDGARPPRELHLLGIDLDGFAYLPVVETLMLKKGRVLRDQYGILEIGGDGPDRFPCLVPLRLPALRLRLAVAHFHPGCRLRILFCQGCDIRIGDEFISDEEEQRRSPARSRSFAPADLS